MISIHREGTIGRLRYLLGGDRPSQTPQLARSSPVRVRRQECREWYFTVASPKPDDLGSKAPTYPTHGNPRVNANLE